MLEFREIMADDYDFMTDMFYEMIYVPKDKPKKTELLSRPELAKIIADFGERQGDYGIIVTVDGIPAGIGWYRFYHEANHSYGFVSEAFPELAIAIAEAFRGRGLGKQLFAKLLLHAKTVGIQAISLSVDRDNKVAFQLYQEFGFEYVEDVGTSVTLLKFL